MNICKLVKTSAENLFAALTDRQSANLKSSPVSLVGN